LFWSRRSDRTFNILGAVTRWRLLSLERHGLARALGIMSSLIPQGRKALGWLCTGAGTFFGALAADHWGALGGITIGWFTG
jgi:hypothetical protein